MSSYIIRRLGQAVITLVVVVSLSFAMFRLLPGNPVDAYKAQLLQQAAERGEPIQMDEINRQVALYLNINPNQPIHEAYIAYVRDVLFYQDFGVSLVHNEPVFDILFTAMPWSVFISGYGFLLGVTTSIFLGALMAYKEGTKIDYGLTILDQALGAVPYYVAAIVMLSFFAYQWELFPTGGRMYSWTRPGFNIDFMVGVVHHATLPVMTGFILGFGGSLSMRANAISVMGSDYLRSAQLRGIGTSRITTRYITRNAILPMYTKLLLGIAGIFSSSVITEQIFNYPGVGWWTFEALMRRDYPLLMGAFIFFTTITIIGILVADLTYSLVDPRIKSGGERESY